jgi:hypothetical protein
MDGGFRRTDDAFVIATPVTLADSRYMTLSAALRIVAGLIAMAAATGSLAAFFRQRDRARLDAACSWSRWP